MSALDDVLGPILDQLADRIVAKLAEGQRADLIDQVGSPLGRRKHIEACRARVARGEPGAAIVGRRHFLSRAALAAEMGTRTVKVRRKTKAAASAPVDELSAFAAKYDLKRQGAAA